MNRTTNRFASLIIATLLALGLLVAPAHAEEPAPEPCPPSQNCDPVPAPTDCDETVQDLRTRLATAEGDRDRYLEKLLLAQHYLSIAIADRAADRVVVENLREELADVEIVAAQRKARVQRKVAVIRDLREKLRKARR